MQNHDMQKGILGVIAPVSGFLVSRAETLEVWLRITSLAIGCLVGLLTLISLSISLWRKLHEEE